MVSTRLVGGLAARAVFMTTARFVERADQATYASNTFSAIKALQGWYNADQGLWDTSGWWNSANCLTVLADFAAIDKKDSTTLGVSSIFSNTFTNAQKSSNAVRKTIAPSGLVQSTYVVPTAGQRVAAAAGNPGFLNDFYDDEGWWALGLIRAWDVVHEQGYLDVAEQIFADMAGGWNGTCGGGIWWSKARAYKNAIANELYLSVAASLANRVSDKKDYYLGIAQTEWNWFKASGMINSNNNINDGLTINKDGTCTNNGQNTWSYNQGVVLGGLVELAKASGDTSYLAEAKTLATAAISLLSDANGIIHDKVCEPNCGGDGNQFKGIFIRNLGYLHRAAPQDVYRTVILKNADSIWGTDRNTVNNQLGSRWTGPYNAGGNPSAVSQSSAMDALVAAMAVA